ncbi:MAG TPA: DUF885 domain-containing protein [Chitinophagaceae bacterium]|nr:DUF885 domain-containing protein [Chitinophagaceae bacterium]
MRYILLFAFIISFQTAFCQAKPDNKALSSFFKEYAEETYKLFPLTATFTGDYRYNDLLPVTFTDSYNAKTKQFYNKYQTGIKKFNRATLNDNDKISYDIFKRNLEIALEGLNYKGNRIPFNQFAGFHQQWAQLGNGTGAQPFKTVKDYDDWIARVHNFPAWTDSAIIYFRKGIAENIVLPRSLVIKITPQLQALISDDVTKSVFYGPVNRFPAGFSEADKTRLTDAYKKLVTDYINPSYKKLAAFIQDEYLPKARSTSGIGTLPNGHKLYDYAIRSFTTTNKKPEELFNTGLAEVKRIRAEMEKVKSQVKFNGTLDSFFVYTKTNPKFLPYKTPEEVLDAYRAIQNKIEPHLDALFTLRPKTSFEIRQTEAFRAASAAAQYFSGLTDGSRPGIFYVPIVDATRYTTAKENLFIHEAIPGHHFQIMIQKENTNLPKFRQDGGNSAYSEGWGLYCESLGKLLGCYTDPYQYFYALGDEMHRAIRLVTDAGMHAKGWTREQAIDYMRKNEPITEQSATAEIERYMAIPGQALSYKVGELKIKELRDKYSKQLGKKFTLSAFHDEFLKDGNMPLVTLENKMDAWAAKQK